MITKRADTRVSKQPITDKKSLSRQILEIEFESVIKYKFKELEINKAYIAILDRHQHPTYYYSFFFNEYEIETYFSNIQFDVYLKEYLNRNLIGKICHLQSLVNSKKIKCEIFNDVLRKTIGLEHSICGIAKLPDRYKVILSTHSNARPKDCSWKHYQHLWSFIKDWSTIWVYHEALELSTSRLLINNKHTGKSLTNAEAAVLMLLLKGLDGSEIAKVRNVSKETIKSQIKKILHKTNCRHQNHLFAKYYQGELNDALIER